MATLKGLTQFIGPTGALAAGGIGSVWTYNHSQGVSAVCVEVLNSKGQALPPGVVNVSTNSSTQIVVSAVVAQPAGVTLRIEWTTFSPSTAAALPGTVGTIS